MLVTSYSANVESEAMARLLSELAERYELVVIDTPPTGVVVRRLDSRGHGQG